MKRLLALLLSFVMIFSLVACDIAGDKDDDDDNESDNLSIADIERNLEKAGYDVYEENNPETLQESVDGMYEMYDGLRLNAGLECVAFATKDSEQVFVYCFEQKNDAKTVYDAAMKTSYEYYEEMALSGRCILFATSEESMKIALGKSSGLK